MPKNNDLYRLKQSDDLSNYPQFSFICDFFKNDVRQFLENLTGSSLNSNVALTISKYDENGKSFYFPLYNKSYRILYLHVYFL